MKIHSIPIQDVLIAKNRQRQAFLPEALMDLASSIDRNGLIQPIVVRRDTDDNLVLVAGERRIKAIETLWNMFGRSVRCAEYEFKEPNLPVIFVGDLDPIDAFEMELEENIRRTDLTWQEQAEATAKLLELRQAQARRDGATAPSHMDIAKETGDATTLARKRILVAQHLNQPEVAKSATLDDAFKLLQRQEADRKHAELANLVGASLTGLSHDLRQGDCFDIMNELEKETFDVILTDPPYGIDADQFNDSGGLAPTGHFYDDSWTTWHKLMERLGPELYRVAKPHSHLYMFADIDNFVTLKSILMNANWNVFRTPLIWINPGAIRAPWQLHGPHRKYQICLYAKKGDRHVTKLYPDIITCGSDPNLGWAAQKPVAVYEDLLRRSVSPGNLVLDPFGGSGPIITAAHSCKCKATYIEQNPVAFGIAVKRLKELK